MDRDKRAFDEHRSIEIISKMIADTSAHIDSESGKYFLLWGYTTVIVSLFEYVAQVLHLPIPLCLWGWFAIPLVGGIGTIILNRRTGNTRPKSYVDRNINIVWTTFGLSYGLAFIAAWVYGANLLFLTVMLMGMATVITGKICRHKILAWAGKAGIILSLLFPACHLLKQEYGAVIQESYTEYFEVIYYSEIVIFAVIFLIMMIVPGHILYNRTKRENNA